MLALLSIPNNKININIHNDFAFLYACGNGQAPLEVAKWTRLA